jgi:hypothetical protein
MHYRGQGQSAHAQQRGRERLGGQIGGKLGVAGAAHEKRNQVLDVTAIEDRKRTRLQAGEQLVIALDRSRHLPVLSTSRVRCDQFFRAEPAPRLCRAGAASSSTRTTWSTWPRVGSWRPVSIFDHAGCDIPTSLAMRACDSPRNRVAKPPARTVGSSCDEAGPRAPAAARLAGAHQ